MLSNTMTKNSNSLAKVLALSKKREQINKEIDECYKEILPKTEFTFSLTDHAMVEYLKDARADESVKNIYEAKYNILTTVENFFKEHPNINLDIFKGTVYKLRVKGIVYVINDERRIITIYAE